MVFKTLLSLACILFSFSSYGLDCSSKLSSANQILQCLEEKSPEVQRATLELERAKGLVGVARQWQNPELSADTVRGKSGTENISETNVSLGVPIELGGKIAARSAVASGDLARAEANLFRARIEARTLATVKLHRLRQLLHEREIIGESISIFSKLVSQYSNRLKLSPEQETSVAVFKMAKSEYDLKSAEAQDELLALETYFKISLGLGVEDLKPNLLPSPKAWPNVENMRKVSTNSPVMKAAEAELKTAQAGVSLAQSESWPTVVIGPSMKIQSEGGRSDELYGLNVSLPLPLFNLGGPSRALANAGLKLAEGSRALAVDAQVRRLDELILTYEHSVKVLSTTLSHEDIEKKHSTTERLFLRGVVPSSLVIESHRSFVELERSRNERELKAIETLMLIYAVQGKIPEGEL